MESVSEITIASEVWEEMKVFMLSGCQGSSGSLGRKSLKKILRSLLTCKWGVKKPIINIEENDTWYLSYQRHT